MPGLSLTTLNSTPLTMLWSIYLICGLSTTEEAVVPSQSQDKKCNLTKIKIKIFKSGLDQYFLNFNFHLSHLAILQKAEASLVVLGEAQTFAFLTSSEVMLTALTTLCTKRPEVPKLGCTLKSPRNLKNPET